MVILVTLVIYWINNTYNKLINHVLLQNPNLCDMVLTVYRLLGIKYSQMECWTIVGNGMGAPPNIVIVPHFPQNVVCIFLFMLFVLN